MATKAKKNFIGALQAGAQRDQELRRDSTADRISKVDAVLEGRAHLLQEPSNEPTTKGEREASFYVETALREGRLKRTSKKLSLSLIDDNPLNSRKFYDDEKVKARAASIAAEGQLVPAYVAPSVTASGRYTLIDGHYRKRALHHLNHVDMDVWVLEGLSPVDFYKLARTLNSEREQETVLDVAFAYRQLLDAGIARTEEELIPIVGESKSKINKVLALVDLPQPVLDVMSQHGDVFGVSIGYELTLYNKVAGADKTAELAERIAREGLPFSKVEAIRKKAEEGTKAKRNTSRQYKIVRGGAVVGTLKEWDSGRVTLDMTFDDPAKREAYVANMKQQLELEEGIE